MSEPLLCLDDRGLYCPAGDFYIDPWRPVPRAVLTHGHADHARSGCEHYLVAAVGEPIYRVRLGNDAPLQTLAYGESLLVRRVRVSLHPAGHILGSAQVRLEHRGEVWVVSGDYKTHPDQTCTPYEPVVCHTFITESTFGLPIYRWPAQSAVFAQINAWWHANAQAGKASLLYAYALGKAQRLLAGLDLSIGPIYAHGSVLRLNQAYRLAGVALPDCQPASAVGRAGRWTGALVLAPPIAHGTPWMRKFAPSSSALASGWMTIRGMRRRRAIDRGFVLSDHADWPGLLAAIAASRAERVLATHGYTATLTRYLREQGIEADSLHTRYQGEVDDAAETAPQ